MLVRDGRERRRLIASLVATQEEMAAVQDELARMQRESGASAERTRVSRDLHDTVAQSLSSVGVGPARGARGRRPGTAHQGARADRCARSRGAGRRAAHRERPDARGAGVHRARRRPRANVDRLSDETGIDTTLHADDELPPLGIDAEIALLRTAQSALANVRTHAGASRASAATLDAGDAVRLDIVDDGAGFDASRWDARGTTGAGGGYGLRSMRARLRELGGGLDVETPRATGPPSRRTCRCGPRAPGRRERCGDRGARAARRRPPHRPRGGAVAVRPPRRRSWARRRRGEEAVALARHLHPDVVLCDLRLGAGMDGAQTTAALRAQDPAPAVLILTTFDRDAEILGAVEAGAAGYLLKDIAPDDIVRAVRATGGPVLTRARPGAQRARRPGAPRAPRVR